jgi:hypothetical protein
MKLTLAVCASALLVLPSCIGPNPKLGVVKVAALPDGGRGITEQVRVLPEPPAGATSLGTATGTSCKNVLWDPPATEADALAQLRIRAAAMGANAVAGVTYSPAGTSLVSNCWSSVTATAQAFVL